MTERDVLDHIKAQMREHWADLSAAGRWLLIRACWAKIQDVKA